MGYLYLFFTRVSQYQKGKTNLDLLKQETVIFWKFPDI